MAEREWAGGDLARTEKGGLVARTATRRWVLLDDGHSINLDHEPRPLVVIDPEDRDQVEMLRDRLFDAIEDQNPGRYDLPCGVFGNALQAALREFANPTPPKPPEPTGLGAVVVDRDGSMLIRVNNEAFPWRATGGHRFSWDQVDHLTTLSEGAEPMADWEIDLLRGES